MIRDLFHTRIGPALTDASTWPSIAGIVTGGYLLPSPWRELVIGCGVVGVLLKGGGHASGPSA